MKIAVYSIARNEEANVRAWAACARDADYIVLADTGSTDATWEVAEDLYGVKAHSIAISPWRFDDARNAALALVPADVDLCISLDLDERLQPGWREPLEKAFAAGVTRPRYHYVWNWLPDGSPGISFDRDHIHTRHGYRWRHPVHENLVPLGITEVAEHVDGVVVHHYADPAKDRSSYLDLLAMAVLEDPEDDRNAHYLARELMHYGQWIAAEGEFTRHLALPRATWNAERAASMRFLARVVMADRGDIAAAESWLLRACAEAPEYREPWLDLALHYLSRSNFIAAYAIALRGLMVTQRPLAYLTESGPWTGDLEGVVAICRTRLGSMMETGEPKGGSDDRTHEAADATDEPALEDPG